MSNRRYASSRWTSVGYIKGVQLAVPSRASPPRLNVQRHTIGTRQSATPPANRPNHPNRPPSTGDHIRLKKHMAGPRKKRKKTHKCNTVAVEPYYDHTPMANKLNHHSRPPCKGKLNRPAKIIGTQFLPNERPNAASGQLTRQSTPQVKAGQNSRRQGSRQAMTCSTPT